MKKDFRNIVVSLIHMTMLGISEVSAQCDKGRDDLVENQSVKKKNSSPYFIKRILSFWSFDPNEIVRLDGYDAAGSTDTLRWVSATQTLAYTVYFENDVALATAAASKALVTPSNIFNFNEFTNTSTELNISLYC